MLRHRKRHLFLTGQRQNQDILRMQDCPPVKLHCDLPAAHLTHPSDFPAKISRMYRGHHLRTIMPVPVAVCETTAAVKFLKSLVIFLRNLPFSLPVLLFFVQRQIFLPHLPVEIQILSVNGSYSCHIFYIFHATLDFQ